MSILILFKFFDHRFLDEVDVHKDTLSELSYNCMISLYNVDLLMSPSWSWFHFDREALHEFRKLFVYELGIPGELYLWSMHVDPDHFDRLRSNVNVAGSYDFSCREPGVHIHQMQDRQVSHFGDIEEIQLVMVIEGRENFSKRNGTFLQCSTGYFARHAFLYCKLEGAIEYL